MLKSLNIICLLGITQLTGCSYFFPDKEKDYVYSREISALEVPPALQQDVFKQNKTDNTRVAVPAIKQIEFIEAEQPYLYIKADFPYVWRVVSKALTAESLEITDKNREQALYYVQYDPENTEREDDSFWHEILFFFADDVHQEQAYQIALKPLKSGMAIYVQDTQGVVLADGDGLKLLTLLFNRIDKDFKAQ